MAHLARALHANGSLTQLQLRDVGVGGRGVRALAEALRRHPSLTSVGLEENGLEPATTEGATALENR